MSELSRNAESAARGSRMVSNGTAKKPVGVSLVAVFFTGEWLFFFGSLVYTLFHRFTPEMRHSYLTGVGALPLGIAELNGLLTVVASLLLWKMKKLGARLLLVSTLLLFGLGAMSWPALLQVYLSNHNPALLRSLLMGGSNLVLHVAATMYAFHLDRRGLLR